SEIGLAVFATTLAICAVFVPVAFMEGIIGRFFYQFGMTITFAVLISLFCAFTIAPMLSSRFLKEGEEIPESAIGKALWNMSEKSLAWLDANYRKLLAYCLDRRGMTMLVGLAIFIVSIVMLKWVPVTFFPKEDRSEFSITYTLPEGTNLEGTKVKLFELIDVIQKFPGVKRIVSSIASGSDQKVNKANVQILLVDREKRAFSQHELMDRMRLELSPVFGRDGSEFKINDFSMGGGGRSEPLQFILKSDDFPKLIAYSDEVAEWVKANVPGAVDVSTSKAKTSDEYQIQVDKARAADLQLSGAQIGMTLRSLFEGEKVSEIEANGKSLDVRLRVSDKDRTNPGDLDGIILKNRMGQNIQLNSIANIKMDKAPSLIERIDGQRQITVLANFTGKDMNRASDLIQKHIQETIPPDITYVLGGMTEIMKTSIRSMLKALAIAVLLVFMVLCAQYESYLSPLVIMVALPLSLSGAFGSLLITRQVMSVFTMIGIILLMGLVTKNGILLIDFTLQRMREGLSVRDALLDAGPIRLRPILMTTFAAGGGMIPIAIGHGLGGEGRSPMGVAVIGGLLMSTLLTLVVVPCVFSLVEGFKIRLSRHKSNPVFAAASVSKDKFREFRGKVQLTRRQQGK
ncbi:MAG: efflux RND transporter permease subunit, partial [Oligoflexales bacterium]|nr:efflux RND transporter permease subunit [Oligoflexales bacterium]